MGNDDVGEPARVDDLGDRRAHRPVHRVVGGMDQRRPVVVDQELIEADRPFTVVVADAVGAVGYLCDLCHELLESVEPAPAGSRARASPFLYDFQCQFWMFQNGPMVAGLFTTPSRADL